MVAAYANRQGIGIFKLKGVREKVHPHERADVEHQDEKHQPILQGLGRADHRLQQDRDLGILRCKLVEDPEQPQGSQRLERTGTASRGHQHGRLDEGDHDHEAIEECRIVLEVAQGAPGDDFDHHLEDENPQEALVDVLQNLIQDDIRRKLHHHHDDDVRRDNQQDKVLPRWHRCKPRAEPNRSIVLPQLLLNLFVIADAGGP
mmetsp:Transcript_88811/g.287117  ORF Transcript_88811/g.287117 Transcript_88811/m.287117 type:complete len:203 (-) Transcript_88811:1644-2252(-)